jgi:glycosyltransferase involved in cell wall biosynthesis
MNAPAARILYASFDEFPGPKGCCRHIEAFVSALGRRFGDVTLVTPGPVDRDPERIAEGVWQTVVGCPDANPIGRARTFRAKLIRRFTAQRFDAIHFRSIFEGTALVAPTVRKSARVIYEVNGFPSIEMKYHYRGLIDDPELPRKLVAQENDCLRAADRVITVSETNRLAIEVRDATSAPIEVIRNGVDLDRFEFRSPTTRSLLADQGRLRPLQLGYFGTLSAWQGVDVALEALELLVRDQPARLIVLGVGSKSRIADLRRSAERRRIAPYVEWREPGDLDTVVRLLHEIDIALVPLLSVDRNTIQGCCPLKMLEAMAAGSPIVASDLPVVREIAVAGEHFIPARPGDARNLKNGIRQLAADQALRERLAGAARAHVAASFPWSAATGRLIAVYEDLLRGRNCPVGG